MNTTATTDDLTIDELKASIAALRLEEKAVLRKNIEVTENTLKMASVIFDKITTLHVGLKKLEEELTESF